MTEEAETFTGFRPAAVAFLQSLRAHNDRTWFEAHRAEYESELRRPLASLVEEVDVALAEFAPEIIGHPKRSIFRIHRDVRFSDDKSPYKTHVACWFYHVDAGQSLGTGAAHGGAGFYFHLEPGRCSVGGGVWKPPPASLRRIRDAIDAQPDALSRIVQRPALTRRFGRLATEAMLTRMPRGYDAAHAGATLLRHRSFTVGRQLSDRELFSAALPRAIARDYAIILPLVRWLNAALGFRALARR